MIKRNFCFILLFWISVLCCLSGNHGKVIGFFVPHHEICSIKAFNKLFHQVQDEIEISEKGSVKTDSNGKGRIIFTNGSSIKVGSNTELRFLKNILEMKKGNAKYIFKKRKSVYQIKLPSAIIAVYGTTFTVKVRESKDSEINMIEGSIGLKGKDGGEVTIKGGYTVNVSPKGEISIRKHASIPKLIIPRMVKTIKESEKIFDKDNPENRKGENAKQNGLIDNMYGEGSAIENTVLLNKNPEKQKNDLRKNSLIGDIDEDGKITSSDSTFLQMHLRKSFLSKKQALLGDVNKDGTLSRKDLQIFRLYFQYSIDFSGDQIINNSDFEILKTAIDSKKYSKKFDLNLDGELNVIDINNFNILKQKFKNCYIGNFL